MDKLDEKIKELSTGAHAPEKYHNTIEEVLKNLPNEPAKKPKRTYHIITVIAAFIVVLALGVGVMGNDTANANILKTFGQNILEILGLHTSEDMSEDDGVQSKIIQIKDKPDLSISLQEFVMDKHNIYLNLIASASSDIEFDNDVGFAYFGVCRGDNFNQDDIIGGPKSLKLIQVFKEDGETKAQYLLSISTDETLSKGEPLVAFFHDLTRDPNGDYPKLLIEGKWKIQFDAYITVTKEKTIQGSDDMTYPFLGHSGRVDNIELSPLGITITTIASGVSYDELNTSDIRIEATAYMIDGTKLILSTKDESIVPDTEEGSIAVETSDDDIIVKYSYKLKKKANIDMITDVTIEGVSMLGK